MKKILVGLLALGSISSFAQKNWQCGATDENGYSYTGGVATDIETAKENAVGECEQNDGLSFSSCTSYDFECDSSGRVVCEATDSYGHIYFGIGASTRIATKKAMSNCESSSRGCEGSYEGLCKLH